MTAGEVKVRVDTTAGWAAKNPVLANGEPGFDSDLDVFAVGDGSSSWSALPKIGGTSVYKAGGTDVAIADGGTGASTATDARSNLGLGTMATATAADYLPKIAGGASVENIGAIESNVLTVATSGATETLDLATYGVFDITMDQNCTFTFSNPAPSGKATIFTLILRGAFTPTLPASVDWGDGAAPTYTSPSQYVFTTVDGGTTYLGQQVGKAFS